MSEEQAVEPVVEAPAHEFNKELQQSQQIAANHQRNAESLQTQVDELRQEAANRPEPVVETEGELDAYEQVKVTTAKMSSMEGTVSSQASLIAELQTDAKATRQSAEYKQHLEGFDKRYGSNCRNGALNRASQVFIDQGYTLQGTDFPPYANQIGEIDKAYIHEHYLAKEKANAPVTVKPQSDNGLGGTSFTDLGSGITPGSMDEVIAQMNAR